jgi:hypothetical protein
LIEIWMGRSSMELLDGELDGDLHGEELDGTVDGEPIGFDLDRGGASKAHALQLRREEHVSSWVPGSVRSG